MFIFKTTQKRANPYAQYVDEAGTTYPRIPAELLDEIPDPLPPEDFTDETYYCTEQDDAPYVVFTRKSDEQIEQARKARIQSQIDAMERDALLARPAREFMLLQMEAIAAGQGVTPEQLREQHYGYRKVKEFDETIAALRASL